VWLEKRVRLVIGFIELLNVTKSTNYAVTVLRTSQITIGHIESSQYVTLFNNRCLVSASNGGRSRSSGFPNCRRPLIPASHNNSSQKLNPSCYLTNLLIGLSNNLLTDSKSKSKLCYDWRSVGQSVLVSITHLGLPVNWPYLKYLAMARTENTFPVLLGNFCVRVCWGSHVIAIQPLPVNGSCFQSHYLATSAV
jgi:hypothetical protein